MGFNKVNYARIRAEYARKYLIAQDVAEERKFDLQTKIPELWPLDREIARAGSEIMSAAIHASSPAEREAMINEAKRPVIYAGGGVIASGAAKDVAILAHKAEIPVATTLMGLGAFDERDPLALRLAGMHGTPAANWAINEADLIIALGVRFSDRVTGKISKYAPKAKIVHVDCDPSSIGKNVEVDLGIVADVKDVLTTVGSRIKAAKHTEWLATIAAWQKSHPVAYKKMHVLDFL